MKPHKTRKSAEKRKRSSETINIDSNNSSVAVPIPVNGDGIVMLKIPLCLAKKWEEHASNEEVAQINIIPSSFQSNG